MDESGRVLAKRRLPDGVAGMTQLHELIGRLVPDGADDAEVVIGIETGRGPWVVALIAAGYAVFPVNPLRASRYRERHGVPGREERRRRRAHAGRHGARRFPSAVPGCRG